MLFGYAARFFKKKKLLGYSGNTTPSKNDFDDINEMAKRSTQIHLSE